MEHRNTVLGIALCTVAFGSAAMSMGPSRGSAVIGQPLELSFDIGLDPGMDAASACAQAELFYGDTRIDSSRFRISTSAGAASQQAVVRLVSNVAVNEPVVSVVLRAGCGQTLSRRYVLLSSSPEMAGGRPGDVTTPFGRATPPAGPDATVPFGEAATTPRSSSVVRRQQNPTDQSPLGERVKSAQIRSAARAAEARHAPATAPRRVTGTPSTSLPRPRLELQSPAEWLEDLQLPLRYSNTLATLSAVSPEQRAAAAALWRTLNGEAVPIAGSSDVQQRTQVLEQQNKTLREGLAKTRLREAELQAQLEVAQRESDWIRRWAWPGAIGAVALLAIVGAAVAVRRKGRPAAWWKPRREREMGGYDSTGIMDEPEFVDTQPSTFGPLHASRSASSVRTEAVTPAVNNFEEPADFLEHVQKPDAVSSAIVFDSGDTRRPVVAPTPATELGRLSPISRQSVLSVARELRGNSAEALMEVRQNAEFFTSLGQYEEAIDALQQYIAQHPRDGAEAYLDLFQIFHTLSLTDAYRRLREQFNAAFNATIPVFAAFLRPTRLLESYEPVMEPLVSAWGTASVLDTIEDLMVPGRTTGKNEQVVFELEAFRELLMLYEIAKSTLIDETSSPDTVMSSGAPAAVTPMEFFLDERFDAPVVPSEPTDLDIDYQPKFPLSEDRYPPPSTSLSPEKTLNTDFDFSTLELADTATSALAADSPAQEHSGLPNTADVTQRKSADPTASQKKDQPSNLIDFDAFDLEVPKPRPPRKP